MVYITIFYIGVFIGFALFAIISANSNSQKMEHAYNKGVNDGKNMYKFTNKRTE